MPCPSPICHLATPPSSASPVTRPSPVQVGLNPTRWLNGRATLLRGTSCSLGMNVHWEELHQQPPGLSFQVGQSDILLFRTLPIHLTVQIGFDEDSLSS